MSVNHTNDCRFRGEEFAYFFNSDHKTDICETLGKENDNTPKLK